MPSSRSCRIPAGHLTSSSRSFPCRLFCSAVVLVFLVVVVGNVAEVKVIEVVWDEVVGEVVVLEVVVKVVRVA